MPNKARVIADYGKSFVVEDLQGTIYDASAKGKRVDYACGDWVDIIVLNKTQAVIQNFYARSSLLYRQDLYKSKVLAANVNQILFVLAVEPAFNENLLQRALLAAEVAKIKVVIVINKSDLKNTATLSANLNFYQQLGYPVCKISALYQIDELKELLQNQVSILMGQSGMGKSTIINGLMQHNIAKVNAISDTLNSGRHTTTHTIMYQLNQSSYLIDSPGLQRFGLNYINIKELLNYFPDMSSYIGQCRFHNCLHQEEPGCAIKQAAADGAIKPFRLEFLQEISREVSQQKRY